MTASDDSVRAAQERSRAQYAEAAPRYAVSASHASGADLAWFAARAASIAPTVALDVACGGGQSTRALLDAGHRVIATDLTPESVVAARGATQRPALGWVAAAAERLPVRAGSVPLVTCRIAAHHFGDIARFVDEVTRVLTPGGTLLLVDTTVPEDDDLARWIDDVERRRDPSHGAAWPVSRWRAVCTGARLSVAETTVVRKRHDLGAWLVRSACVGAAADDVRSRFRDAPDDVRSAFLVELDDAGEPVAYSDSKVCLRAVKPA